MSAATQKKQAGRPALLQAQELRLLVELTQRMPQSSMDELTCEFVRLTDIDVCSATIRKALKKAGVKRVRPLRRASTRAAVQGSQPHRYGYTQAHRRQAKPAGMNTDLTDAEWALVHDLWAPGRARQAHHARAARHCQCLHVHRAHRLPLAAAAGQLSALACGVLGLSQLGTRWNLRGHARPVAPAMARSRGERRHSPQQPSMRRARAARPRVAIPAKKVKGRKRHLVVDTLGSLLAVTVTSASVQDRDGAASVVAQACAKVAGLKRLYADSAYEGQCAKGLDKTHGIAFRSCANPPTA